MDRPTPIRREEVEEVHDERRGQTQEELLATIAHEIRDPLTSCIGYAELLLRREDDMTTEERREALRAISRTGRRMVNLLEDVLEVARLEGGSLPYVMRPVDLRDVVHAVVDEQRPALGSVPIDLDMPEPAMVQGDQDRLFQVVANLLSNAVKFSGPRSPVRVATRPTNGWVELTVRDEGIGIEPHELPLVFERFMRITQPGRERIPGTGLGLYITRTIVEAHHGRIWAESTPGRGSTFHVVLPAPR